MKTLYLDKKQRLEAWFSLPWLLAAAAAGLLLFFAPVWPDLVECIFVLEARQTAVIRATVPGTVREVFVDEGAPVQVGSPLLKMENLTLESKAAAAGTELTRATARASAASQRYTEFAPAEQERLESIVNNELARNQVAQLSVTSPIAGTVTTTHLSDLVARSVDEGDMLLEVADFSNLRAQLYIPEFSMHDVRIGQRVRLLAPGWVASASMALSSVSPSFTVLPAGLLPKEQLQGINPPRFYLGAAILKNDGTFLPGMSGEAKIVAARRSLAGFCWRFARDLVQRKVW